MATDDKRAEMEYLVGNFKPTDKPSDNMYDAVYDGLFWGNRPTSIRKRQFLVAFAAADKMINGNKKLRRKLRQENKMPTLRLPRQRKPRPKSRWPKTRTLRFSMQIKPRPKPRRLPLHIWQTNRWPTKEGKNDVSSSLLKLRQEV